MIIRYPSECRTQYSWFFSWGNKRLRFLKIWFINRVDNVNWPPYRDWKADVSSVSPSSKQIDLLWRRANARNVSFSIPVRWSIYIVNSVDKPNFRVSLPHRRSTTVSLETNPLCLRFLLWTASCPSSVSCDRVGWAHRENRIGDSPGTQNHSFFRNLPLYPERDC